MRHLIAAFLAILALCNVSSAQAQEWTTSETVPTWSSAIASWTPPIAVDSPHPADAYEPAASANDDVLYDRELWTETGNSRSNVGTNPEAKFRTECRPTFIRRADPILYRGQHPAGHGHTFFGPTDPYIRDNVENFDYAMGRAHPGSACQGGPLNTTLYWEPSIYDDRYGLRLTVMPARATFYYTITPAILHEGLTHLRRNIRFIGGADPANYNDTARRAEYAAAGLEYPGTLPADGTSPRAPAGFKGIACYLTSTGGGGGPAVDVVTAHQLGTGDQARYLKGPNGEDPWNGGCNEPGEIIIAVNAPDCWDPNNLSSPNGRDHFRYSTRAPDNTPGLGTCPTNYAKVAHFETKISVPHNGWQADLQYWYLSSDRMRMATTECPDAASPCDGVSGGNVPGTVNGVSYSRVSDDPCRQTGLDFCNFATAHFDWWGAWDNVILELWQIKCVGIPIDGVSDQHADCHSGDLDDNLGLRDFSETPPQPGLSTNPMGALPTERASASAAGQKYFPINADDQNQDALTLEVHPHD